MLPLCAVLVLITVLCVTGPQWDFESKKGYFDNYAINS